MRVVDREASRLLVMSPTHSVLLMRLEPTFRPPFWVTPKQIASLPETVYPAGLGELVGRLIEDGLPPVPIDLGAFLE
jgi:hypothetical protein